LRTFENRHVVRLAARFEDPRHHADEEHLPDAIDVGCCLRTEINREQSRQAGYAVPRQPVEIIAHRMESAFVGADINRLMHDVLADALQP